MFLSSSNIFALRYFTVGAFAVFFLSVAGCGALAASEHCPGAGESLVSRPARGLVLLSSCGWRAGRQDSWTAGDRCARAHTAPPVAPGACSPAVGRPSRWLEGWPASAIPGRPCGGRALSRDLNNTEPPTSQRFGVQVGRQPRHLGGGDGGCPGRGGLVVRAEQRPVGPCGHASRSRALPARPVGHLAHAQSSTRGEASVLSV